MKIKQMVRILQSGAHTGNLTIAIAIASILTFPLYAQASPTRLMTQGWQAFRQGAFARAASHWEQAAQRYAKVGDARAQSLALTQLSQAYQALGHDQKALVRLVQSLVLARQAQDPQQVALILGYLGNVHLALGNLQDASMCLQQGIKAAEALGDKRLIAEITHHLGNLLSAQKQPADALRHYRQTLQLAAGAGSGALASRAAINAARTAMHLKTYTLGKTLLDEAWGHVKRLPPSHETAFSLIGLGQAANELRTHLPDARGELLQRAAAAFTAASEMAETQRDQRSASYAWGYLGQLYESEHRYEEALQLTRRAGFAAQQVPLPESLYLWQWQTGRLLHATGDLQGAIDAHRRAIHTLRSMRDEMGSVYGRAGASFRQAAEPVYFGLVDLLLQQSATLSDAAAIEAHLREAQAAVELLKGVELAEYFQDECVARANPSPLEIVSQTAVVIYPIILADRLELLVAFPSGLQRFTVPVDAAQLTDTVHTFRRFVQSRTTRRYLPHAWQLYDWLIRPLEAALQDVHVDTLVFVPDGPLRTIPMAALHDREQFLIEKYAVATSPGLTLTEPQPLPQENARLLVAGLTEAVQGFPPLPHVTQEIDAIGKIYTHQSLMNESYLKANLQERLREVPFTIVHIASHGEFNSEAEDTFILTYDGKLTLDQLDEMIGLLRLRDEPIELLTLSACQTAVGDDRAALGLAGIAVKAGVRSALATLWYINDEASADLVSAFYQNLQKPSYSRATALQQAQLQLLQTNRYRYPAYWAPFLLLNNWL